MLRWWNTQFIVSASQHHRCLKASGFRVRIQIPAGGRKLGPGGRSRSGPDLLPVPQTLQLTVNVLLPAEALQQGDQIQQLRVRHVVEPGLHRDLRRTRAARSL